MIRKLSSSKPKISDEQGASQAQLQVDKAETKHLKPYLQKYKFNMKELIMLKKRYKKMSHNGFLDRKSFMDSLGLLGLETAAFLCNRIFDVIDEDGNQICNFDEFLCYMNTLIYGSSKEKAMQSFKLLDVKKCGTILKSDLEEMVRGVSQLWNSLTGSKVKATREYIQTIFDTFDVDGDGIISFQDYELVHEMSSDIFGWFEFFNQEDEEVIRNDQRRRTFLENQRESLELDSEQNQKSEILQGKIKSIEAEISTIIQIVQTEREKSVSRVSRSGSFVSSRANSRSYRTLPDLNLKKSFSKESPVPQKDFLVRSATATTTDLTPSTITTNSYKPRNVQLGGPQFLHEGPIQGKVVEDDDDDDLLFSPRERVSRSISKDRSLSPFDKRERSISPSPFDYYYEGEDYEEDEELDKISELQRNKSYTEINNKLEKLQDMLLEMKGTLHSKTESSISGGIKSNASSTRGSEQGDIQLRTFERTIFPKDPLIQSEESKMSKRIISEIQGNESRSKKKDLQITIEAHNPKAGDKKQSHKYMGMETKEHRKNISVFFGHENWNLVLNMMIGLRVSIKSIAPRNILEKLHDNEFKLKSHYDLIQKRVAGFDIRKACKFYDFFPHVFEDIRRQFGITSRDFLKSCGPETLLGNLIVGNISSLTELSSAGKSGSFFYFSEDGKYMLKTIPKREAVSLKRIIREYYHHLMSNENTLIAKIFGLYKMKFYQTKHKSKSIYFIVMGNLFASDLPIDVRYDLKGSTHGRTAKKKGQLPDRSVALKDLDFNEEGVTIELSQEDKEMLKKQIELDAKFCANAKVIDYSLLLGIHYIKPDDPFAKPPAPQHSLPLFTPNFCANRGRNFEPLSQMDSDPIRNINEYQGQVNQKVPKFYEKYYGGMLSSDKKKIYVLGIIDMLTEYTSKKRAETLVKSAVFGRGISCVPPADYANRFKNYLFSKIK